MKFGYARASIIEEDSSLQIDALKAAGCEEIITDQAIGKNMTCRGLDKLLDKLRFGDELVVWRLDKLGKSLKHLIELVTGFENEGIKFNSLTENINTGANNGKLIFNIFYSLAQCELHLVQERTQAGLDAARARGRQGGRKKIEATNPKVAMAKNMHKDHGMSINDICKTLKISRASFYRYIGME